MKWLAILTFGEKNTFCALTLLCALLHYKKNEFMILKMFPVTNGNIKYDGQRDSNCKGPITANIAYGSLACEYLWTNEFDQLII